MKWCEKKLEDFGKLELDYEDKLDTTTFEKYLDMLKRFNLILQKNSLSLESIRKEAIDDLEKSRELTQTFILERTQLKDVLRLYEKTFLEVFDMLENMVTITENTQNEMLIDFVRPVEKRINDFMGVLGWCYINTDNTRYHSDLHYALKTTVTEDTKQVDFIAGVIRKGYRCGDRIIRKAEVMVYDKR